MSSNTAVERWGRFSNIVRTRIGSPFVIEAMDRVLRDGKQPVAGYEANGGFLLGSAIDRDEGRLEALPTRDAMLPILSVLAMAARLGGPLSQVTSDLPARFTCSDRLPEFETQASSALLERLTREPGQVARFFEPIGRVTEVNLVDGLRVTLATGDIVHLRPSGNAPELRCYAESDTPEHAARLCAWGLARADESRTTRA